MTRPIHAFRRFAIPALLVAALSACAGSQTKESSGELLDDSAITAKVKTNLVADKSIDSLDISVETFKGRVLLAGYVRSTAQRQHAEELARSVGGVKAIENRLVVK